MPRYLLALSIGPVQDFIAAARRTRDLWFGSHVLSEVSKAAAKEMQSQGATLIFPNPQESRDLEPDTDFNVANKLIAEADTDDPEALLEQAKQAARICWRNFADDVMNYLKRRGLATQARQDVWLKQIDDVLEFYSAWVVLPAGEKAYAAARPRLEDLLAARKNTRDFLPSRIPDGIAYGLPKSSLDGLRETVLPEAISYRLRRLLNLGENEQLDCPGLVKRLGGKPEQFTPISRVAVDPWLRGIQAAGGHPALTKAQELFDDLVSEGLTSRVSGNEDHYGFMPFDGELLYSFRIDTALRELEREQVREQDSSALLAIARQMDCIKRLRDILKPVWERFGEPYPYTAVLQADGDKMREILAALIGVRDFFI